MNILIAAGVAVLCAVSLKNYRWGLSVCFLTEVLRDPIRKVLPDQPVWVTIAPILFWLSCFFGVMRLQDVGSLLKHRVLRAALMVYVAGVTVGCVVALIRRVELPIIVVGFGSYLVPLVGLFAGWCFWMPRTRSVHDARRSDEAIVFTLKAFFLCSCIPVALAVLEAFDWSSPLVGGIQFEWVRYHDKGTFPLMSGGFRSPDILGFHSAIMLVVATIAIAHDDRRPMLKSPSTLGWLFGSSLAMMGLLMCGRRKMLLIPAVYAVLRLAGGKGLPRRRVVLREVTVCVLAISIAAFFVPELHLRYLLTLLGELPQRIEQGVLETSLSTLRDSGVWGDGIGTATQGNYYLIDEIPPHLGWQEDGMSRLLKELGVIGTFLFFVSFGLLLWHTYHRLEIAKERDSRGYRMRTQLLALTVSIGSCYLCSHQHLSGDPAGASMVLFFLGVAAGGLPPEDTCGSGDDTGQTIDREEV